MPPGPTAIRSSRVTLILRCQRKLESKSPALWQGLCRGAKRAS